jgi:hypothetical protein
LQAKLRIQFLAQSIWPLLQFFAAIFVIAGMLFILASSLPPDRRCSTRSASV